MRARRLMTAGAIAVTLLAAGCGDDGDNGGGGDSAITKAEFVRQANTICRKGGAELDMAFQGLGPNSGPAALEGLVRDELVPNVRQQIEDIRALGYPEGDGDLLDDVLTRTGGVLTDLEEDPLLITNRDADPFDAVNQDLNDYGLTDCGS